MRRLTVVTFLFVIGLSACAPEQPGPPPPAADAAAPDAYLEYDIARLQASMDTGELSAVDLVDFYLARIEAIDRSGPRLNSVIELNPDARTIAEALDDERQSTGPRSPLHGIPVLLKANIDTGDRMATTAGSLALEGHIAPDDANIVAQLRDAGAVILGKANLSEWANFRSTRSSSGWSSIGGQTRNPYDPLRNPCGSSSGSGVSISANLAVLAVGTETDGSIVCPASINGIVGIKPTLGLVSRDGIIPIAISQDTAGPMARTVRDAALMLNAMSANDPGDPASGERPAVIPDYASGLSPDGLAGKRIGAIRNYGGAGSHPGVDAAFDAALDALRAAGAEIVDDLEPDTEGMGDHEYEVLLYEYKAGLASYFAESGAPVSSLADVIAFNEANAERTMPFFGQEHMIAAEAKGGLDDPAYLEALSESKRIARGAIDQALAEHELDALVAPSNGPAWMTDHVNGDSYGIGSSSLAAISGYPNITVPSGYVFDLPVGLSFIGRPFDEPGLIRMAYAFEQATKARRAPDFE